MTLKPFILIKLHRSIINQLVAVYWNIISPRDKNLCIITELKHKELKFWHFAYNLQTISGCDHDYLPHLRKVNAEQIFTFLLREIFGSWWEECISEESDIKLNASEDQVIIAKIKLKEERCRYLTSFEKIVTFCCYCVPASKRVY